jgi:uncharacterized Zn-binding protein involved in type VI secretion
MPLASRIGIDQVAPGGVLIGSIATVRVQGVKVAQVGTGIPAHGAHGPATMITGSAIARSFGIPLVRAGDAASCGHVSTGSGHVSFNA